MSQTSKSRVSSVSFLVLLGEYKNSPLLGNLFVGGGAFLVLLDIVYYGTMVD